MAVMLETKLVVVGYCSIADRFRVLLACALQYCLVIVMTARYGVPLILSALQETLGLARRLVGEKSPTSA